MDWWRKKKPKFEKAPRAAKSKISERGAMLLEDLIECCDGKSNPIKFFSAHQIQKGTENFSQSNHVSELSDSEYKWYSGKNENHPMILIRIAVSFFYGYRHVNFFRDISISSMVSGHKNFMKLVGCCLEFEDPVMVYHGVKKHYNLGRILREQPWKRRIEIAEDIAISLAYLHTAFPRPFVYKNMSPEKILLDEDGVAKLSDFYSVVSIPKGETFVKVDKIKGTYGYLDHNYVMSGLVSEKTDVFAIGMLMQTLLIGEKRCGRFWIEKLFHPGDGSFDCETTPKGFTEKGFAPHEMEFERTYYPNWQSNFLEERRMNEIVDPNILEKMGEISEGELCQMKAFRKLSQRCIGLRGEVPTMVEVAKELKNIQRSLRHDSSSSSSGETQFDSPQDISSSVLLSNQALNTNALLTSIACQVFHEMFQWVILRWFRFFRKNRKIC